MLAVIFLVVLVLVFAFAGVSGGHADIPIAAIGAFIGLFALFFAVGIYIAAALGILGFVFGLIYLPRPFWNYVGEIAWAPSTNFILVAVPLFLLMGEIMLRAGLSAKLYRCISLWTGRLPGGLLHTNIVASGVFSAIAGSSVATAATMGSVALPYFRRTHYAPKMVLGSLAAGGALGNLIPPGITFVIYGLMTETSIGALYIAAIGPSILMLVLFMLVIFIHGLGNAPESVPSVSWSEKLWSLLDLVPTIILIALVLGTIYVGWATPTESAALGVVGAIGIAIVSRQFSFQMLHESALATAYTTAMVGLIIFGAYILNFILTGMGVPQAAAALFKAIQLPPWLLMLLIIGFYIALGTFMEGMSMVITTIPIIFPIVKGLGYDPIWFGVVVTMLVEIALISPPDGTVLYVLHGMRRDGGSIVDVFAGVMPFLFVYIFGVLLLMVWPEIALYPVSILQR
jgi:tripartite ATP-independent transporter DctM subunit